MALITISLDSLKDGHPANAEQAKQWCSQLEAGDILFFPETPVALTPDDLEFLRGQQQTDSSLHKNIAYKPRLDKLSGYDPKTADPKTVARLHTVMRNYSQSVTRFLTGFLTPYAAQWKLDYASFRPLEEHNRYLPLRRRNDLLHTDAFPTRPTQGARILRFFNNIHPTRTRDWVVSDPFAETVRQFIPQKIQIRTNTPAASAVKSLGRGLGLSRLIPEVARTPYDDFMMRFHNTMKEDDRYQRETPRYDLQLPAGSSWMVYTDTVPHAVLAGQYALEQTFLVQPEVMVRPEVSPLQVLESIAEAKLT